MTHKQSSNTFFPKTDLEVLAERSRCALVNFTINEMKILYANNFFFELLGYTRAEYMLLFGLSVTACIHPDDQQALKASIAKQLEMDNYFRFEYRVLKKDGSTSWILMNGSTSSEENSRCNHCSCIDITDLKSSVGDLKKQYQKKLDLEHQKHQILSQLSDEIIWEYDIKTGTLNRSGNIESTFSTKAAIPNYKDTLLASNVVHAEDKASFIMLCDELSAGKPDILAELRFKNNLGQYNWYKIQGSSLSDYRGQPIRVIGKTLNINPSKQNSCLSEEENQKDALTNLSTKGCTQLLIEEQLKKASPGATSALLIVDLDDFKPINEMFGHQFGDIVIIDVANTLSATFENEIIGRIAGAEFVVFLANIKSEDEVRTKAHNLCFTINTLYSDTKLDYPISCSIGIALSTGNNPDYEILFRKADTALYIAKNNGKNGYEIYGTRSDQTTLAPSHPDFNHPYQLDVFSPSLDSNFITSAIDLLKYPHCIHSSIRQLLASLCLHFDTDHACVVEYSLDNKYSMVTHDWCTSAVPLLTDCFTPSSMTSLKHYEALFQKQQLFSFHDISSLKDISSDIVQGMISAGIKSTLQFAIYENNQFCGFVGINDSQKYRLWSKQELSSFTIVSKLIATTILNLRETESKKKKSCYDKVTGLFTFSSFIESANDLLIHNSNKHYALIALDIDNFKLYNDTYGFSTGNKILHYLTKILLQHLDHEELCSRLSGDHFVLLITYQDQNHLLTRLNKLKNFFDTNEPSLEEYYKIHLSFGIYLLQPTDKDVTEIIDNANLSRLAVKTLSGTHYQIYTDKLLKDELQRIALEKEMEKCLVYGEFIPYYQPKFSLLDDQVIGAEVFARLVTPEKTILLPKDFLPIFEKNGLIVHLDFYILEKVCIAIQDWMERSLPIIPVAINISGLHLKKSDFILHLTNILAKYKVPPKYIELEFTEQIFIDKTPALATILHQLKDLGFMISMDNSGLEFVSLNELTELCLDKINVDQHIYAKILSPKRKILMSKMVEAAKALDIQVAFTGIETTYQCEISKELGFDSSQGYLFTKPMPLQEFEKYIQNR